jgi:hypothetical protein
MNKISGSVFLFITLLLVVPHVSAQNLRQESRGYQCLSFVHCSDGGSNDHNQRCEPTDDDTAHTSAHWGHRSQIDLSNLSNLEPDSEILVTECLSGDIDLNEDGKSDPICTTGSSEMDKFLFCGSASATGPNCDHLSLLQHTAKSGGKLIEYSLDRSPAITTHGIFYLINGIFQKSIGVPIKVGSDGKSTVKAIEWEAHTPGNLTRKYLAWTYSREQNTPTPIPIKVTPQITEGIGGQQQNILTFEEKTPVPTLPPADIKDCQGQAWDPYGLVFDARSLEPIPAVDVFLKQLNPQNVFDSEYAKSQNLLITNPESTDANGAFTFFVKDGDYQLQPIKQGYSQLSSTQQSSLLANTKTIYSDIYFTDSPAILQRGAIQHRDIPLMPTDGIGKEYPLQIISEDVELSTNGKMIYSGRVSHPYAEILIEICKKQNGVEVCGDLKIYGKNNGGVDKNGKFLFTLDQTLLQSGEYYRRSFRKVNLTEIKLSSFNLNHIINRLFSFFQPSTVNAQEPINYATLQPIVSYIEGFAYDLNGNLIPNAQVLIKVPLSEMPIYQTRADKNGYYKITSEFLPNTEYSIEYLGSQNTNETTKITTSQFTSQNADFIAKEKINPYSLVTRLTDPRKTIIPSYVPAPKISVDPNEFQSSPSVTPVTQVKAEPSNSMFLIGAILLLLIAAAGTLIGIYLYRRRSQDIEM